MKLFVGNLPFGVTDQQLQEMFDQFGTVTSAKVIVDRDTGRSRGFGFVEFSSSEEAENAMKQLDGSSINGRPIVVKEARETERRRR